MNQSEKQIRYPAGIQSFSRIREGGYRYVDKTAFILQLRQQGKYYFLSRPRRFGKSLFLSTLEAYFLGQRELFDGLEIDRFTEDWTPHPVFRFDLNTGSYHEGGEGLLAVFRHHFEQWEKSYGSDNIESDPALRFAGLIRRAYEKTGKGVVILIDEYDKPLLNAVGDPRLADKFREILKSVYSNLKTQDRYIEFAMLTGVGRFSKVSIFSDLNNLTDISFDPAYGAICGITEEELERYFYDSIEQLASKLDCPATGMRTELRQRYDGFRFAVGAEGVYNPYSLMRVFSSGMLEEYWSETGTPTYLVELMKRQKTRLSILENYSVRKSLLMTAGILSEDPVPALYQTGYLTISGYDPKYSNIILSYPNSEVKQAFLEFLLPNYTGLTSSESVFAVDRFCDDVENGETETMMSRMKSLIAGIPYAGKGSDSEAYFQNVIYLLFTLMGFHTHMEMRTSDGRIDLTVEAKDYIYIFEFKINSSAEAAISQIHNKGYIEGFLSSGKHVILIGANFSTRTRRLTSWISEKVN